MFFCFLTELLTLLLLLLSPACSGAHIPLFTENLPQNDLEYAASACVKAVLGQALIII